MATRQSNFASSLFPLSNYHPSRSFMLFEHVIKFMNVLTTRLSCFGERRAGKLFGICLHYQAQFSGFRGRKIISLHFLRLWNFHCFSSHCQMGPRWMQGTEPVSVTQLLTCGYVEVGRRFKPHHLTPLLTNMDFTLKSFYE